ncbi:MAG TPA: ChaN family lipoprotein [Cyclobacteriaceae bacterium]|mgnify:CR=1 FL=1|nr:ChaN family lipoprotein [Cyclobacteriaceae bacterium]
MKKLFLTLLMLAPIVSMHAQDKALYKVYTREGKPADYQSILRRAENVQVILFGELHDNPVIHWLELQLLKDLHAKDANISIGMEMFEADDQIVLDEYLTGVIEERHLTAEAKLWNNYKTDYKPLIEFAKANKLPVVASNIPRRYANLVYRKGIDALLELDEQARNWIAPLPVEIDLNLPGYKSMISSMGGHGSAAAAENLARSQAMKDATMSYFSVQHLQKNPGRYIHYHGTYHSKDFEGIYWYLKRAIPDVSTVIIHAVEQQDINTLDESHKGSADFIIVTPGDLIKTY